MAKHTTNEATTDEAVKTPEQIKAEADRLHAAEPLTRYVHRRAHIDGELYEINDQITVRRARMNELISQKIVGEEAGDQYDPESERDEDQVVEHDPGQARRTANKAKK